jgi:hypothetical protein
MFPITTLAIAPSTLLDLLSFAAASGSPDKAAEIADQAIRAWLAHAHAPTPPAYRPRGYQWKTLFLPEDTQLRIWSREEGSRYAEVKGDEIIYAGRALSPNQFVSLDGGVPRNAWTEILLLLPGETAWKAARVRREELRRAARALRNSAPAAAPPASSAHPAPSPSAAAAAAPYAAPPGAAGLAPQSAPSAHHPGSRPPPEPPQRLPRIPPIASQARIQAAQGGTSHWWPGAPERRVDQRRAEDAFLD